MLLVGDRVVLRANGPPEVEYTMFEIGDIELRASEPGRVREHGYQTTASRARMRLAQAGFTAALARECAVAMHPVISETYARGPSVRAVARYLGPLELFQSESYDATAHVYRGTFLELATLARDLAPLGGDGASAVFHALYLTLLLETEPDDTTVFLATDTWTRTRKPGERSHRRATLGSPRQVGAALSSLAETSPQPAITDHLARADVIAFLRDRAFNATNDESRALYADLERNLGLRVMPERGPLAFPDLWAIEERLDAGAIGDVMIAVTEAERTHGRTPGTTYLRARASLALDLEPARRIAERVSALALSMTSFQELSLLAAEAWLAAGDGRRAMPYARDLVDAPQADEGLRLKAQRLLARAVGAAPDKVTSDSVPAPAPAPSRPAPPITMPEGGTLPPPSPPRVQRPSTQPGMGTPLPPAFATPRPPPLELDLPPPPPLGDAASFTLDLPGPETLPRPPTQPPASQRSSGPPSSGPPRSSRAPRRRISGATVEERVVGAIDPRAEPDDDPPPQKSPPSIRTRETLAEPRHDTPTPPRLSRPARTTAAPSKLPPKATAPPPKASSPPRASAPPFKVKRASLPPPPIDHGSAYSAPPPATSFMAGATHPPYRVETPAPHLARAPLFPRARDVDTDEAVESLSLPPGVAIASKNDDVLPQSILEARVEFTRLARELGVDYRIQRAVRLVADLSGLEAMQAGLLEMFPERTITNPDDAMEMRRHGAMFAEVLARRLDAEWVDIAPAELGDWSMIVPPDMRVWPFGRIARLVQMGHRERDLVSTYLELEARARRARP